MNAVLVLLIGCALLIAGYLYYGRWLAKQWGVDETRVTPAHELEDDEDYYPAAAPVLMGHHFSSIAGAGPINGPIQAAVFGWLPVALWVVVGGIFFGAVHDFGALFASIRHKGQPMGEVVRANIGARAKKMFIVFAYLTLLLIVATFSSMVAGTFDGVNLDGSLNHANASVAQISLLFIVLALLFGYFVNCRGTSLGIATLLGILGIVFSVILCLRYPVLHLDSTHWMVLIGIYIVAASVAPAWLLLQPRDYLSSFLLYGMMAVAGVGIVGAGVTGANLHMDIPAFTGWTDTISSNSLGSMFPALFVTIACGAISGFHSLVGSGTTSKLLDKETDAKPIAYGGMLMECVLALISLCAVGFIWADYQSGAVRVPTQVFAAGLSGMVACIPGLADYVPTVSALLVLTVSAFCLTSLDTATRLARYMFQEFWLEPGESYQDVKGVRGVLCSPVVATLVTVVLGVGLGMGGYSPIWPLFGAANQLLAALVMLTVCVWLGKIGRNNKMFLMPMAFMMVVTVCSLIQTILAKVAVITAQGAAAGPVIQLVLAVVLLVLAFALVVTGGVTFLRIKKSK